MANELQQSGRGNLRDRLVALLDGVDGLDITPGVVSVAQIYVRQFVMPNDAQGDALHLALASFYACDVGAGQFLYTLV